MHRGTPGVLSVGVEEAVDPSCVAPQHLPGGSQDFQIQHLAIAWSNCFEQLLRALEELASILGQLATLPPTTLWLMNCSSMVAKA